MEAAPEVEIEGERESIKWLMDNKDSKFPGGSTQDDAFLSYYLIQIMAAYDSEQGAEKIDNILASVFPNVGSTLESPAGKEILSQLDDASAKTEAGIIVRSIISYYPEEKKPVAIQQLLNIVERVGGESAGKEIKSALGLSDIEPPPETIEPTEIPITDPHHPDFDWGSL